MSAFSLDVNGDGEFTDEDSWGFASNFGYHAITWGYAIGELGVQFIDGEAVLGFNDERFYSLAEWLYGILYGGNLTYEIGWDLDCDINWDTHRVFMQAIWLADLMKFRDCESPYGIIPYPKYDETQETYYSRTEGAYIHIYPITLTQYELAGAVTEAMACESRNMVIPVYYDEVLKSKYTRDRNSTAMLDLIYGNRFYDLGDTLFCSVIRDGVFAGKFKENDKNLQSTIKMVSKMAEKTIKNYVKAFDDLEESAG
jgi:hypothetical protein